MKVKRYTHSLRKLPLYYNGINTMENALCYYTVTTKDGKTDIIRVITDKGHYDICLDYYTMYEDENKFVIKEVYNTRRYINENFYKWEKDTEYYCR